jgi:3-deoxy-D-manno-octulosonic-acid transferase
VISSLGYRLLLWVSFPLLWARLWWRGRKEPGYRQDIGQRFGHYRRVAPGSDKTIWLHAVSVGETRAAEPLIKMLRERYPDHRLLITHMTATGRETAQQLYSSLSNVEFAWLPYDYPSAMRRFLAHFSPALGIVMETEIWPNLLRECRGAGVPVLLANARLSKTSAEGYRKLGVLAQRALEDFSAIAAQTADDARRLMELGAPKHNVSITGNLKFDVAIPTAPPGAGLREIIGDRPVFLAASTREGEEALILEAAARQPLPAGALLLIVPRHPQRFDEVARLLEGRRVSYGRRSALRGTSAKLTADVLLGDSMGEMPSYYRAADCAYIGGSIVPFGGQNLIEACALGVPVLIGPHTFNFTEAAENAVVAGAALRVKDADELLRHAAGLLSDAAARKNMSEAGLAFVQSHRGATLRTLAICEKLLV